MRAFRTQNTSSVPQQHKLRSLRRAAPRLLGLLVPHRSMLLIGFIGLALGSGINLLFPYLVRAVLNGQYGFDLAKDLSSFTILLVGLFALQACFFFIRHYCFQVVGLRIVSQIREMLFSAMLSQDIAFFDRSRVGDLLSRINSDTEQVQRALTINISVGVRYLIQVLGGITLLTFISPRLTLVMLGILPLLFGVSALWSKRLRQLSRRMQNELGEASVIAEESISSIRTVRIFSGESREADRFNGSIRKALETGTSRTQIAALFSSSMVFLMHSAIALVVWYGGSLVLAGNLSVGDLTGFLLYVVIVAVSFAFLTSTWVEFLQAAGAAERIFDILDEHPLITSPESPAQLSAQIEPHVVFSKVSFSYPSRTSVPVFRSLSFSIRRGETLALVGPSGAGKSTVASLLLRMYDPDSGSILFNGQNLSNINLDDLRSRIAVVPQTPQVFSVSILENIRYGRPNATLEDIKEAADRACLTQFIESLPEKFETLVGDKGIQLSGGERQRLAIARAMLRSPELLILDEATSSLDSNNEKLVQLALEGLMAERSALIIAHRLSTVQHADRVLVMRDGEIEQIGTHRELMDEPGLYQTLVQHQILS